MNIGFIGLGDMGFPMAENLLKANFHVTAFDLNNEKLNLFKEIKGSCADSICELVKTCDIIISTLPSSDAFLKCATQYYIPNAKVGQIFIEMGTTVPYKIVEISAEIAEKGAYLLDCPMNGGMGGAKNGKLRIFVGGEEEIYNKVLPILQVLGNEELIYYCGASGQGQVAKGVNQLLMGLENAISLEILNFCQKSGANLDLIKNIFANNRVFGNVANKINENMGNNVTVKFRELPYYLAQAEKLNFKMPITQEIYDFCDKGERIVIDDHRDAPAFFNELNQ